MSETRPYDNSATQAEKREVLRDTYLNRAAADADLAAQGRFKRNGNTSYWRSSLSLVASKLTVVEWLRHKCRARFRFCR